MQRFHPRDEGRAAGVERGGGGVAGTGEFDGLSGGGQRGRRGARGVGGDGRELRPVVEVAGFVARLLQREAHLLGVVARGCGGRGAPLRPGAAPAAQLGFGEVDHRAAAQRLRRRAAADEVEVPRGRDDGPVELDLGERLRPGRELVEGREEQMARRLRRADVEHDGRARLQGLDVGGQVVEAHVEEAMRLEIAGRCDDLATFCGLAGDVRKPQRDAFASAPCLHCAAVHLQPAHAVARALRQQLDLVAELDGPRARNARDDRAEPLELERPFDVEEKGALVVALGGLGDEAPQGGLQRVKSGVRLGGETDALGSFEKRAFDAVADVRLHARLPRLVGQVAFVEDDEPLADAQHADDLDVFDGLGHHAVVGGDDEHDHVDAAGARDHVVDEALVPRHVDDAETQAVAGVPRREAQVDRHAARHLLGPPRAPRARERLDDRGLAVVDVARSAERQPDAARGIGRGASGARPELGDPTCRLTGAGADVPRKQERTGAGLGGIARAMPQLRGTRHDLRSSAGRLRRHEALPAISRKDSATRSHSASETVRMSR